MQIKLDLKAAPQLDFPSVTICNLNPILETHLKEDTFKELEQYSHPDTDDILYTRTKQTWIFNGESRDQHVHVWLPHLSLHWSLCLIFKTKILVISKLEHGLITKIQSFHSALWAIMLNIELVAVIFLMFTFSKPKWHKYFAIQYTLKNMLQKVCHIDNLILKLTLETTYKFPDLLCLCIFSRR